MKFAVRQFILDGLDAIDAILDHRVTAMALWVIYFGIQDLLKDPDVQTLIESPASIQYWTWATWVWIVFKASLPMIGGVIAYKSDTWARKGLVKKEQNENQTTNPNPPPGG